MGMPRVRVWWGTTLRTNIESSGVPYSGAVADVAGTQRPNKAAIDDWAWFTGPSRYHPPLWYRAFEIGIAGILLVLTAPVVLFFALLVKLESPGPAFFRQQRMTTNRRPFGFIKLRTMYVDWERRFPSLSLADLPRQDPAEIRFKTPNDPRATPLGRWLRRTSIDELPNFWHVITGEMALVGPRPEIPQMLPHYRGAMLEKFSVRPGITGYAQIYGRGDLYFSRTVHYDLRYVQERSLAVDLRVLRQTIASVLLGRGAY